MNLTQSGVEGIIFFVDDETLITRKREKTQEILYCQ